MATKNNYTVEEVEEVMWTSILNSVQGTIEIVSKHYEKQPIEALKNSRIKAKLKLLKIIIGAIRGDLETDKIVHISKGRMYDTTKMKEIDFNEFANLLLDSKI